MQLVKEVQALIRKEIVLEWRQRYALNGMLLYVVSTVLICYMSFNLSAGGIEKPTWNALYWIILLFAAVNAVAKSFVQERYGRFLYYYTLVSPQGIILSKIVYNAILMLLLSLVGYGFYSLMLDNPVEDHFLFILSILLGAAGFSTTLTMVSGIASKASNNSVLMAILSFPVIIPMLLMLMKVSKNAMDGLERAASSDEILTLAAINMIVITLSYILFPYLWRS
jgi:heme exporter protein B